MYFLILNYKMKFLEFVNKSLFQKQKIVLGLSFTLLILLHKPVEILLDKTLVNYALAYVDSVWFNDVIFFALIITTVLFLLCRFRKYNQSSNFLFTLSLITVVYIIYRFYYDVWNFTPFSFCPLIKYADFIIFFTFSNFLLLITHKKVKNSNGINSFFDDEPIGNLKDDELGYTAYAGLLAGKIISSNFNQSFAIGVNGKWGMGKTSFIDLVKRELTGEDIIEINFKPWNSNLPKAIVQDFFETVQESIGPYHSSLSRLLLSYSNKLVSLNENTVTQTFQTSVTALTGLESVNSLFESINVALSKINKKIIIYIDDLDRLDKDEIVEVIRLIRNTANFYNTFFIVAYDKNYVVNALKDHNPHKQEQFLEKIFQIEISLPYFNRDIFRYKLAEKLKQKFPQSFHSTIDEELIGTKAYVPEYLNEWLTSMRDVTRLANTLLLNLSKLQGEVAFKDFLRLELLRVKYPAVYELLFVKTQFYLDPVNKSGKDFRYELKKLKKEKKDSLEPLFKNCDTELELYLQQNNRELSVPVNEIGKIITFISGIFAGGISNRFYSRSHLSVAFPSKFNRYFAYNLLQGSLSEVEFSNARKLNQSGFNEKISEWVKNDLVFEVKSRFGEVRSFDNASDFEKIIRGIFHLANHYTPSNGALSTKLVGYDGSDLVSKLNDHDSNLTDQYYGEPGGKARLKGFVRSLFEEAKSPYAFESHIIKYATAQFSDNLPLKKNELGQLALGYFKSYCLSIEELDENIWDLFHNTEETIWVQAEGGGGYQKHEKFPDQAKAVLIDFILKKDLDGFLLAFIEPEHWKQKTFAVSNFAERIFDNWGHFKRILEEQSVEKSIYLEEFKSFFSEFEATNFSQYVDFKFQRIPINTKIRK